MKVVYPMNFLCPGLGFRGPWRGTTYMVAVYQGTSVVSTSLIVVHIWWKKGGFLGELVLISSLHFCNWFKTMIQRESPFDRACTTGWITWGAHLRLFRRTWSNHTIFLDFWYLNFPCKKLILTERGSGINFCHFLPAFFHQIWDFFLLKTLFWKRWRIS